MAIPGIKPGSAEEAVLNRLISKFEPRLKDLTGKVPKNVGLTEEQIARTHQRLEDFSKRCELDFKKPGVLQEIAEELEGVFASMFDSVAINPPDEIREAGMSEIVISNARGLHPVLTTYGLGPCVGLAGYDPMNRFGFVTHIVTDSEIEKSGKMLLERIQAYRQEHSSAPLFIHLRGGIKGVSESTIGLIKQWMQESGILMFVVSEEILAEPILPGTMIPEVPGSLRLDVRTGSCERYDPKTNFYAKKPQSFSVTEGMRGQVFQSHQGLQVVYDSQVMDFLS